MPTVRRCPYVGRAITNCPNFEALPQPANGVRRERRCAYGEVEPFGARAALLCYREWRTSGETELKGNANPKGGVALARTSPHRELSRYGE